MSGWIIILNGVPRAGKSSIARAIQASFDGIWINLGVDVSMAMTPKHMIPGIGLRPGGERPDLEPIVKQLYGALFDSIAAHSRAGINIVCDIGIHDHYSKPLGIREDARPRLAGLPVLFVGVMCPIETIMERRNADPQSGRYATGPGIPEPVRRWQEAVHKGMIYDLTVDTGAMSAEQCAELIGAAMNAKKPHG